MNLLPARAFSVMALLLAGGLGCPAMVQAAGLTIAPVVVEIDQPRRAVAITVTNTSNRSITLQAASQTWRQVEGRDETEPSDDLIVVPAMAKVGPNSSQVFRVALRRPAPVNVERSYRMLLEDISDELKSATNSGPAIAIRLSHNLPVMVAPTGPVVNVVQRTPCEEPAVTPLGTQADRQTCVRLVNSGNRRIKIEAITLSGEGWEQKMPVSPAVNVLAGASREWRLPLASGQTSALRAVQVHLAQGPTLAAEPATSSVASAR